MAGIFSSAHSEGQSVKAELSVPKTLARLLCMATSCAVLLNVHAPNVRATVLPIAPGSWTLAILPDTQFYSQSYPEHYIAQTQWLADHAASHNIQFVLHEGDVVHTNVPVEWDRALAAMNILTGVAPYAIAPGNHDYGANGRADSRDSRFNDSNYFGSGTAYATQPTIGGFYEPGRTDNSFHTFQANGQDWLVLALEFGPRDEVVGWANQVVANHPQHSAILVTHAYMYSDDTRYNWAAKGTGQNDSPYVYGVAALPGGVNDGEELWDNLVSQHENFRFVFNGHVTSDGSGYLGSQGVHGNIVHQMLANYQFLQEGGLGYLRLLEFKADGQTVDVRTYSPVLDSYDVSFEHQFTLNMSQIHPPLVHVPPLHAVAGNVVVTGPANPVSNTAVDRVVVTQTAPPGVSVLRFNRGDFQIAVDGDGARYQDGILMASVRQNVRENIRATVEVGRNSFSDGIIALSTTKAGSSTSIEVNIDTAVAWFEFAAGWRGAHVNANGSIAAAGNVIQNVVARTGTGRYTIDLGAGASSSDGMLFAIANNNANTIVQSRLLSGGGWDLRVQDNGAPLDVSGKDANFSFIYLPYDTAGLIGGLYDGTVGASARSVGAFAMQMLGTGQYELTIPGESPETGMLLLTVADLAMVGGIPVPSDMYLSYEADALGNFIIEARGLPDLLPQDTQFVWAFIGFSDSIAAAATQAVPEPAGLALAAFGLLTFGASLRKATRRR